MSTVRVLTSLGKEQPEKAANTMSQTGTYLLELQDLDPLSCLEPSMEAGEAHGLIAPLWDGFLLQLKHLPCLPALQSWPESSELAPLPCDLCRVRNQPELIHVLFFFPSLVRNAGSPMSLKTYCSLPLRATGWTGTHRPSWDSHALYRRRTSTKTF